MVYFSVERFLLVYLCRGWSIFFVQLGLRLINFFFPEPGYYEDGKFGIRLENVLVVTEADTKFNFGDRGYLSFEHITWVSFHLHIYIPNII